MAVSASFRNSSSCVVAGPRRERLGFAFELRSNRARRSGSDANFEPRPRGESDAYDERNLFDRVKDMFDRCATPGGPPMA